MKKLIRNISLLIFMMLCFVHIKAQSGIFIPKKGKVFFSADTSTIFSNVINQGNFGVGKNAVVNFKGHKWENDSEGQITDATLGGAGIDGIGGLIRFIADDMRQQLVGGYNAATKTGASFYNLQIQNSLGVELLDGNAKVRNEVTLSNGLVYLNENILTVGHNHPGIISGYQSARYFVMANKPGTSALLRENIKTSSGIVTFPVGTLTGYTPAALRSKSSRGDDYYVNVFDSARAGLFSGKNLASEGVNKTWEIGKMLRPGEDEVEVMLQHLNKDEGTYFAANKNNSYIARYDGTTWDEIYPQNFPGPGYLATGPVQTNSGVNIRENRFVFSRSFFTKLTGKGNALKTTLWFNAFRLDRNNVRVLWKTNPEVSVQHFIVQRRLADEVRFKNVDTVTSKALNGISTTALDYTAIDPNGYNGVSFYRLLTKFQGGDSVYSNIVAVGAKDGPYNVMLWPNPTPDRFFVALNTAIPVKTIVIYNVLGQKMWDQNVEGTSIAEIKGHHLRPGTYFVSLLGRAGTVLETKKLVIAIH